MDNYNIKTEMIDLLLTVNEMPKNSETKKTIVELGGAYADILNNMCKGKNKERKCTRCRTHKTLKSGNVLVAPVVQILSYSNEYTSLWKYDINYYTYDVRNNKVFLRDEEVGYGIQTCNRMYFVLYNNKN